MRVTSLKGYEVWSDGSIRSKNSDAFKKPCRNLNGYMRSSFYYEGALHGWLWHRFVAEAFLGKCPDGYEVNHKNGVRDDNRLCNLEYLTKGQNNQLSYDSGRRDVAGERNANCKSTLSQIEEVCRILARGDYTTTVEIAERVGVTKHTVRAVRSRRQWCGVSKDFNF